MKTVSKPHHEAWLSAHPERSSEWLNARILDGFDVHHLDGDHSNNDPLNLVLIDHVDHMRLHGMTSGSYRLRALSGVGVSGPRPQTLSYGQITYAKRQEGKTWRQIGFDLGIGRTRALNTARTFAAANDREWPVRDPAAGAAVQAP